MVFGGPRLWSLGQDEDRVGDGWGVCRRTSCGGHKFRQLSRGQSCVVARVLQPPNEQ